MAATAGAQAGMRGATATCARLVAARGRSEVENARREMGHEGVGKLDKVNQNGVSEIE